MKFIEHFKDTLFEEKEDKKKKDIKAKKGLKLFYLVDIKIEEQEEIPEQPPQPAVPPATPEQPAVAPVAPESGIQAVNPQESFKSKVKTILEDEDIDERAEGIIVVSERDVDNIQTIEDLIDFLSDKNQDNGRPVIDEFTVEVINSTIGIGGAQNLGNILQRKDRIIIDLDYGTSKLDSVGIKIQKRSGVNDISIMMKKNGNIIPSLFKVGDVNNQILTYRNSIFGDTK